MMVQTAKIMLLYYFPNEEHKYVPTSQGEQWRNVWRDVCQIMCLLCRNGLIMHYKTHYVLYTDNHTSLPQRKGASARTFTTHVP